jgi:hypothetical protein
MIARSLLGRRSAYLDDRLSDAIKASIAAKRSDQGKAISACRFDRQA